jgi:predicted TIM-barrel enzyme
MATRYTADEVRERLRREIRAGRPILAGSAGSGLTAKCAVLGGADLLIVYNSGRYRMAGLPSLVGYLPVGDANAEVLEMGRREILPLAGETPVVAGVLAVDPTRDIPAFLGELSAAGFAGVINFPTVGRIDGAFRRAFEELGFGYTREAEMVRHARGIGLFTLAYCFTPAEAALMARSGADVVVAHLRTTGGGLVGLKKIPDLRSAFRRVAPMFRAARRAAPGVLCFAHGGPLATPQETAALYRETDAEGFVAASSIERLPTEEAVLARARAFKAQRLRSRPAGRGPRVRSRERRAST